MAVFYDGQGLCGVDTDRPLTTEPERAMRDYLVLLQQAVLAWGTNSPANARGEHSCLGGHLSRIATDNGSVVNDYIVSIDMPSIEIANQGLYAGFWLILIPTATNTGTSTLTITPLGSSTHPTKNIHLGGAALDGGELEIGQMYILVYNGSSFELIGGLRGFSQTVKTSSASVIAITDNIPDDNTKPQNDEGIEIFTLSIVPKAATNRLRISGLLNIGATNASSDIILALFKDDEPDAIYVTRVTRSQSQANFQMSFLFEVAAVSLTSRTYKLRLGNSQGSCWLNGDGAAGATRFDGLLTSTMVIDEIK